VDEVADLELGLAEDLGVGLGGQQAGEGQDLGVGGGLEGVVDAPGFGLLVVGEVHHGDSFAEEFMDAFPKLASLPDFPPTAETLTPSQPSRSIFLALLNCGALTCLFLNRATAGGE
jgi:hypothetical protein